MQNFDRVLNFYSEMLPQILSYPANDWAIDPYAWDSDARIRLTPIEEAIWEEIRAANAVFYPQVPVAGYFVDFGNPKAKVAIECDGRDFHQDFKKDAARQQVIESLGWMVYRISGCDCMSESTFDVDDETGKMAYEEGHARNFIARIADNHRLRRSRA